jgi:hypothetical protein
LMVVIRLRSVDIQPRTHSYALQCVTGELENWTTGELENWGTG